MTKLHYQNPTDRSFERTGILRKLFGPSQAEIWNQLAARIDAEFKPGSFARSSKVIAEVGEWTVTLDTYTESSGESAHTCTRLRAPYINRDSFRFTIYPASIFTPLGKMFGMQDIEVGYPKFDDQMVVKAFNDARVRLLLSDRELCDQIMAQAGLQIQVRDDEGWFATKFPENVDELCFTIPGFIKDIERLHDLFNLFARLLNRLCAIGSAYENDPGIELK
jgi:hypothetical protein